jgi:CRP/FNR family cyclic AMP-dependent transcriptional regulator
VSSADHAVRFRLLGGVPPIEANELLAVARRCRFRRGEVVFRRDDPADCLHLIAKGRFAIRGTRRGGATGTLAVRGVGDSFGETALVAATARRTATVTALEPAETFALHESDLERLRSDSPSLDRILFAFLAAELRRHTDRLLEALFVPADLRLRRRLLELAHIYGGEYGTQVEVPLSPAEVANIAGTSRATAGEILRAEQQAGTLELRHGRLVIRDRIALARRAAEI